MPNRVTTNYSFKKRRLGHPVSDTDIGDNLDMIDTAIASSPSAATFVVTASNSLHKERADYVCDGVDDQVEINQAISELTSERTQMDKIILMGTFNIRDKIVLESYTHLELQGKIKAAANTVLLYANGKQNFIVENGIYDGQRDEFVSGLPGIELKSCNDFALKGVTQTKADSNGVYIWGATTANYTVTGCRFIDTGHQPGGMGDGIRIRNSKHFIVNDCIADGATHDGFDVGTSNYFTMCNNVATRALTLHSGFIMHGCDNGVLSNNIATLNEGDGIRLEDVELMTVTANHINENEQNGIWLVPNGGKVHSCVISSNLIANNNKADYNASGIRIGGWQSPPDTHIVDNNLIIGNNIIYGSVPKHKYGIEIYASGEKNTIVHNELSFAGETGAVYDVGSCNIFKDNRGYLTKKSGTSTGTGAQQTIAHGLVATPTKVILWNIEDGANPYQSAAADGTNIKITAVINQDYGWEAEV